jgi:hypothetical protein
MHAPPDYLTHFYLRGTLPFRSLSPLPDAEALAIMRSLCDETVFGARFKDPLGYLNQRRQTETQVRAAFIARGGEPRESYPIYMVLGSSPWMAAHSPDPRRHCELRIPLSIFSEQDLSFTYPDSMVSWWLAAGRPARLYLPELHGQVFTRAEILSLVAGRGLPEDWQTGLPPEIAPYIEAQVWNRAVLLDFLAEP